MNSQAKDVMTVLELCDYLQLSEAKVREMLRQGTLPAVLIGRQWRIRKSAIDSWLAAQEQAPKVIIQRGGKQMVTTSMGGRLGKALAYGPEDLPPPKPPRQPNTIEEDRSDAHEPRSARAPDRKSGGVRRK